MSDEQPKKTWWERYHGLVQWVVVTVVTAVVSGLLGVTFAPVPPPVVVEVERDPGDYTPTFGWVEDKDAIERNADPGQTEQFGDTPAAKAVLGSEDVFLWRAVRKAAGRDPLGPWYPNVNQLSVGCCVGCASKHGADVVQATAISAGARFEWKPVAVEPIYACSRVEVGGGRISGDGSVGAWAAKAVRERCGLLPMERFPNGVDLTTFSPARAREWGRTGVPNDLEPVGRNHLVKSTALVKTAAECRAAIAQGYPVVVCSDQGFAMQRDAGGWAAPQGRWMHAMVFCGWRHGAREGAFCLNSWGDRAHTGGVYPADMPPAGFWVDARVVDRMLAQNDSFAYSDVVGFPQRRVPLDWVGRPAPRPVLFALDFRPKGVDRCDVALAW